MFFNANLPGPMVETCYKNERFVLKSFFLILRTEQIRPKQRVWSRKDFLGLEFMEMLKTFNCFIKSINILRD